MPRLLPTKYGCGPVGAAGAAGGAGAAGCCARAPVAVPTSSAAALRDEQGRSFHLSLLLSNDCETDILDQVRDVVRQLRSSSSKSSVGARSLVSSERSGRPRLDLLRKPGQYRRRRPEAARAASRDMRHHHEGGVHGGAEDVERGVVVRARSARGRSAPDAAPPPHPPEGDTPGALSGPPARPGPVRRRTRARRRRRTSPGRRRSGASPRSPCDARR